MSPPEFGVRYANANCAPDFVTFQNFKQQMFALQSSNAVKTYQPQYSNRVFAISQNYIFNVHPIATLGGKFNIFLART